MSQELLWKLDAEKIVRDAYEQYQPIARFVLFSGGNDSSVLTHWAVSHGLIDGAVYIDTGTAIEGVREFAESYCEQFDVRLQVLETPRSEYERLVLEKGFPGGSQSHLWHYVHLKERRLDALVRDVKRDHNRLASVALLTGCRRAESRRRMGTSKPVDKRGGKLWLNPILDWTNADMADYRREHDLPQSDVAALLHRSGECNCGAFAKPGEFREIETFFPDTAAWIRELEAKTLRAGLKRCRWGERDDRETYDPQDVHLCTDCQLSFES